MRSYGTWMIALFIAHQIEPSCNADLVLVGTETSVSTSGQVSAAGEAGEAIWSGDLGDASMSATSMSVVTKSATFSVSAPDPGDPDIDASAGTGTSGASVAVTGTTFDLDGAVGVDFDQLIPTGTGFAPFLADEVFAFSAATFLVLDVPYEITSVDLTVSDGMVGVTELLLIIEGEAKTIVSSTPDEGAGEIGVGSILDISMDPYAIEASAAIPFLEMTSGDGSVLDMASFSLTITFTAIPEPSTIVLMTFVFMVCAFSFLWRQRQRLLGMLPCCFQRKPSSCLS